MHRGCAIVHWDKWKRRWRCHEGLIYKSMYRVFLADVTFFIQPEGRDRCKLAYFQGQTEWEARFPHAFAFGKLVEPVSSSDWVDISYNPFKNDQFVRLDLNESISYADFVYFYCDKSSKFGRARAIFK